MPRPKAFHPDAALDRAMDLFWRNGFEASSLNALLDAMEISRQSLYNTFGNKRELFLAVLDRYAQMKALQRMALQQQGAGLEEVQLYFERLIARMEAQPEYGACLMTVAAVELGLQDWAVKERVELHDQQLLEALTESLREASSQQSWQPEKQAQKLLALSKGLGVLARSGVDSGTLRELVVSEMALLSPRQNGS
jgi:TetR/AcrR family transcriptional repressor of nem operon